MEETAPQEKERRRYITGKENGLFGEHETPTRREAHDAMLGRMPTITQYRMPREVAERIDISEGAKVIYSFLTNFPSGARLWRKEIAGMCGMKMQSVSYALTSLRKAGLLEKKQIMLGPNKVGPMWLKIKAPPERLDRKTMSSVMTTDITNIEEKIRERFYDA